MARDALVSVFIAAALVAAVTYIRSLLTPQLGSQSPFMLYVAAVVLAGVMRGALCGGLVVLGGGLCGLLFFLSPNGITEGAVISLGVFWLVSSVVLVVANELRLGVRATFARVQAMARRRTEAPG